MLRTLVRTMLRTMLRYGTSRAHDDDWVAREAAKKARASGKNLT